MAVERGTPDARNRAQRFLRAILDDALTDAPDDVLGNPLDVFKNGRHLPLSRRFASALERRGWMMRSGQASRRSIDGIRSRMEIEDLLDTVLVGVGRSGIRGLLVNDQARDAFVRVLYDTFRQKRVVLVRRRHVEG